ncbi:pyrroline-5-carboxylate reductase [Paenibacillus sp. UNCCL117]|uniref:pyrroline-5-carboxylate reductase n=1 Tax=unclassified Paenibacillus TaxID=185978 RepID=UPI000880223A|nr:MULTISPECIES: pyrroline-5-carboxylate reductase [unclassified Paenibacillus]SDC75809.1 pyrroline-5-carboxylate reductase [Paenibacillus sp. cl123]SFW25470.1 pyrroline-5-carboxylate reductase [Paenibacillus sp. UNCCL117]
MSTTWSSLNIAFIGAGSMAEAIIRGLVGQGGIHPEQIFVTNRSNEDRLQELQQTYGVRQSLHQAEKELAIREADVVVIAFKPKDALEGVRGLQSLLSERQLLVSVIAGLSIETICGLLGNNAMPVARTMPNTSSTIGLGATGLSFSAAATETQRAAAEHIFRSTGIVSVVEERLLDAITGLSGSGPAYIYYMMEAMIEGGVQGGLDRDEARRLTVQTVLGAGRMVETTGQEPAELRRKVTSPNGTTQAALELLESRGFPEAVAQAVLRSASRAAEIGSSLSDSAALPNK